MRVLLVVLALVGVAAAYRTQPRQAAKLAAAHGELATAPASGSDLYKCETIKTYNAKDDKISCSGKPVSFACFSLHHKAAWQCFDDKAAANDADCTKIDAPNGHKYDGACVYARDFTFWGKLDGTELKTKKDSGANGKSMAGVLAIVAASAAMMWQ